MTVTWQQSLSQCVTSIEELCALLQIDPAALPFSEQAIKDFPLRVPRELIARMKRGDPKDPLLLQVFPQRLEEQFTPGYSKDPLQEKPKNPVPGLLHKYRSRVLLTLTGACAVNCRYCFRRHFPYEENIPSSQRWQPVLDYIRNDTQLDEVILSGGDPLTVKDALLSDFLSNVETIPHITTVRFHTRLPIMIPSRITSQLLSTFKQSRLKIVMVLHANHAQEFDDEVRTALRALQSANVLLLNQSVLLRGVNDTSAALIDLSHTLFASGVLPYYLHLLDPVEGAAHFDVSESEAVQLMESIAAELPGYLVPRLAREIPGESGKTVVF